MQPQQRPRLYSYVVQHDNGQAPNPYFRVCTLCLCKFRSCPEQHRNIVELAKVGDWIVGTGGADLRISACHGKLINAMRVDKKLTREQYFDDIRYEQKKAAQTSKYKQTRGDNKKPRTVFEKCEQFALISRHFYYFGVEAKKMDDIPERFHLEKKSPGFRSRFDPKVIRDFVEWLEKNHTPGKHGEPCYEEPFDTTKGNCRCKSSC